MSADPRTRPIFNYLLSVAAVAGTTLALFLLRDSLSTPIIVLFFLMPVGASAMGGLGPGLAAAVGAFLAFNYFFIPPYYTLVVHQTQDLFALIVFFIVAVVISQLVGRAQSSRAVAEAREREATHLYSLSTALAGLRDDEEIARALNLHLQDVFLPTAVEIKIDRPGPGSPSHHPFPAGESCPARDPDHTLPLATPRGPAGEVRLWCSQPINPTTLRLLHAFADQGALALERAALAQAETRAQVLEESDRLKSALLSSVSHELRTPLATIKAAATSLRSGDVPWDSPARADLLAAIDEEVDLTNRLVGNLLDMSRIESGALKPQREWNLLAEIVNGVVARLRKAAQTHRIEIDVPEDLPLVPVDYVQMEQVFNNLISNSLKYAPAGTTIRIEACAEPGALRVQVSNHSPTVAPEHLDRIFDKFYRVSSSIRVTGTGLGLSICKGIVEAHGGRIWAQNLPDRFAFNFTLPLHPEDMPPPSLPSEPESV
jgi:two-component system, OmpR family, sensor histidine kinase KdpD